MSAPDVPSAAAIQRAISAANTPSLKPSYSDSAIVTAGPSKAGPPNDVKETPRWPISPRLRSPPPVNKIRSKDDLPSLTSLRFQSSNESSQSTSSGEAEQNDVATPTQSAPIKSPARGPSTSSTTLETVQEISQPATPLPAQMDGTAEEQNPIDLAVLPKSKATAAFASKKDDSGSESASGDKKEAQKSEVKLKATPSGILRPTIVPTLRQAASGTFKKPSEGSSTKNMTVETETVSSVPVVAIGAGTERTVNGSIRAKPSSETIRPKKEKKERKRKQQVNAGQGEHISPFSGPGLGRDGREGRMRSRSRLQDHTLRYQDPSQDRGREFSTSRERSSGWESSDSSRTFSTTTPISHYGRERGPLRRQKHDNYGDLQARTSSEATRSVYPLSFNSVDPMDSSRRRASSIRQMSSYITHLLTPILPASSKADIFEAKIASAVDEADSEDSEETFVYESNPPDHERPRRYHSRTPSATSMASAIDQQRNRSMHPGVVGGAGNADSGHSVAMKKSMKFANSFSQPNLADADDESNRNGTGRGTIRHHHIGRWGRSGPAGAGPNGHQSLFDNESPFPNAKSSKFGGTNSRQGSRPPSPRVAGGKFARRMIGPYDDEGDDERTPLIPSSIRSTRSGRHRRPYSSTSSNQGNGGRRKQSLVTRIGSCVVLSILVLLVLTGAIGFLFATTQPLLEVRITGLKKVLASEGELMFDVEIEARNPNCLGVSVEGAQLSVYARSKYANGGDGWFSGGWAGMPVNRMRRRGARIEPVPSTTAVTGQVPGEAGTKDEVWSVDDSPFDPLPSDPDDNDKRPLLLLGRITSFDNALYFEGSPFRHTHSYSTGEIRIENPGNVTGGLSGDEGIDHWREVVRHEWDLIVQGLIRYELPLSRRIRSSQVRGRISVEGGGQEEGAGHGRDGDLLDSGVNVVIEEFD